MTVNNLGGPCNQAVLKKIKTPPKNTKANKKPKPSLPPQKENLKPQNQTTHHKNQT